MLYHTWDFLNLTMNIFQSSFAFSFLISPAVMTDKEVTGKYNCDGKLSSESATVQFANHQHTNGTSITSTVVSCKTKPHNEEERFFEKYTSYRWITTYMCFMIFTAGTMLQGSFPMVMVCMESNFKDPGVYQRNNQSNNTAPNFSMWNIIYDSDIRSTVLTAEYYGFPFTPLLSGYLSGRFSTKRVIILMHTVSVVSSSLTPIFATINPYIVVGLRFILGLSVGGVQASLTVILSNWAPLSERAQIVSTACTGVIVGAILGNSASGLICTIHEMNGWPLIMYIYSGCVFLNLILWVYLVYDSPYEHPRITRKELDLIRQNRRDSTAEKMPAPPWRKILTSVPFWGLLSAHMAFGFVVTTVGTFLPIYMSDVLKFDITANGLLSSLPQLSRMIATLSYGRLADFLIHRNILSVTAVRKTFQGAGDIMSAPVLIGLSFMDASQSSIAVILLVTYWFINSLNNCGFRVNHIDIAPRFAGVLTGMSGTMNFIAALISPIVTFELTKNRTQEEWQTVFFLCVGISVFTSLIFILASSGVEQDWAKDSRLNIELTIDDKVSDNNTRNGKIENRHTISCQGFDNVGYVTDGNYENNHETGHVDFDLSFKIQGNDADTEINKTRSV